ncbi:MAG: FMN-binding protein [Dehalococcoidales bacterium]|nr:FMN-binding protein [Dehalococcoidales bacterium]
MVKKLGKYYLIITTAIVVFTMSFLFLTPDKVAVTKEQPDQLTLELLQEVFPETSSFNYNEEADIYTIYDMSTNQIGYAFFTSGPMVILVGLEDRETIKGIFVVSHEESPKYWEFIETLNFFDQFNGLKMEDCALTDYGGAVDAASGATISSMSVVDIVKEVALTKVFPVESPTESKMDWQIKLALAVVIPFILIPVIFIWYATIRQSTGKRSYS